MQPVGSTHTQRMRYEKDILHAERRKIQETYDSGDWRSATRDSHRWGRSVAVLTENVLAQLSKIVAVGSSMESRMESN